MAFDDRAAIGGNKADPKSSPVSFVLSTGIICMTLGAVLSFDSLGYAMVFPASYLILATLEGNFITPLVLGRSLTLNPVVILIALTFWGWMWGISGMILAVPILATFKIFCDHIEPMAPIGEFMS